MSMDFGRPPRALENQELVEKRLKEVSAGGGLQETLTVEWRTKPLVVQVIDMPIDQVYFNPSTHRIRAQRSFDPERDRLLMADAWDAGSQDYLAYLLQALPSNPAKRDGDFDELKSSLKEYRQNEPGLITREGVLVNGNTRVAALRELGVRSVRVGVLPESATWTDINAVELSLQLRHDTRRPYSYINRLLTIEEQAAAGRPIAEIAKDFRIRADTAEQDRWVLATLNDLVARSKKGAVQLKLMDFEDQQEKLRELHRAFAKASRQNLGQADLVKENKLALIVLDFSKTDVRLADADFRPRYLQRHLPEELKQAASQPENSRVIPGLNRPVRGDSPQVAAAKSFTNVLLQAKAVERAPEAVSQEESGQAAALWKQAREAVEEALVPAGKDARLRKRKQAAPDRLHDAVQSIEQCVTDMTLARASRNLDEETLDEALLVLRGSLLKLAREAARIEEQGDGVAWLLAAVRKEGA
ncbi:transcriptional regulator [Streptomyces sp. NBC_00249]|uniref:transcriptional regulator n=1 Tax=Streptomyces sp. NBC_00249 TaxID=2975690 RepID=UPI0022581320|nr:transcriptional regulator [Streptomyces sp. NBC_00249]MCX5198393.1 transcriptional regulator [Streptomyces sp. NBC_00249]